MYLLRPSSNAECNVMPLMLNAATPVGAVSNTVISSGSIVPDRRRSFKVSDWISLTTWDFPTPSGPLRKTWYGLIGSPYFKAITAFLHQS